MRQLLRRIRYALDRDRHENELADELRFHHEMKEQELRARGLASTDVRSSAQRAMGNDLSARQRSHDVWVWPWLQDISQDVRFGLRMLLKDRRFTAAAVIALALGIAVNNSVFTIVNAAMLRDLPFEEPHRLVDVRLIDRGGQDGIDYALFERLRSGVRALEGLSADASGTMNFIDVGRSPERLRGTYISTSGFALLRVQPVLGRRFVADDERPGAPAVAIVSYEIWQSRYGGDTNLIGRSVRINETPVTIVGVMPPGFAFPLTARVWMPLNQLAGLTAELRNRRTLNVFGRLAAGADAAQATAELDAMAKSAVADQPQPSEQRLVVTPLKDAYIAGARGFVATLMGAVAFVLLIACANVTSLLLARSASGAREIAIRTSLGASRWRIARQILIESTILAIGAGVVGFVLSRYGTAAISVAFTATEISAPDQGAKPYWVDFTMNGVAWTFAGLLCLLTSLGIGLIPSWQLSKVDANSVLKDGGRTTGTARARRWTGGLLVAQLAVTVILLSGAGLLARGFFALYFKDLVIDTRNVVTMRVELLAKKYEAAAQRKQFSGDLEARVKANTLFQSASLASDIPLQPLGFGGRTLAIEGRTLPPTDKPRPTSFVNIGPGYFETLGLPVIRGRALTEFDGQVGREGVIVNERFATKYFPGEEALGQRVQLSGATLPPSRAPWMTIVGVVPTLPNFFPDRMDDPVVYVPMDAEQAPQRVVSIIVRASGDGSDNVKAAATAALREELNALDPDLPLFAIQTLDEAVARSRYPARVVSSWFLTIALISLILATVGLYALTAHGVAQRVQEIGVRIALGASRGQVQWLFLRRTAIQLAIGLAIGLAGALALGRALQSMIRETSARDPLTIAIVVAILTVVALAASLIPSRRAARMDPSVALRAE